MIEKIFPVSVKIAVHVHATEDEKKVLQAIKNVLPREMSIKFSRFVYPGYYGNPIIRFEGTVNKAAHAKKIFEHIMKHIGGITYPGWIVERFDSKQKSLYVRLDKQAAYLGEIKLGWGDDIIHLIFKFPGYLKLDGETLEKFIKEMKKKSEEL